MHFDRDDDIGRGEARRDRQATLSVTARVHDNVLLCVPGWASRESVRIEVDGCPFEPRLAGAFVCVPRPLVRIGSTITMRHALPTRMSTETMPAGDTYRFAWRGDEISGIAPNPWALPYYPTLEVTWNA